MNVEDDDPPAPQTTLNATVCWMSAKLMRAGKKYGLRHMTRRVKAMVTGIETGAFILIDDFNDTVAAGFIEASTGRDS